MTTISPKYMPRESRMVRVPSNQVPPVSQIPAKPTPRERR
jgi:hypothetical protein